ncbi:hypothetical protein [Mangrovibacillus cuniculi]|nr:hypothetical protein [Mangrovibacillus cuniculi]
MKNLLKAIVTTAVIAFVISLTSPTASASSTTTVEPLTHIKPPM